MKSAAANSRLAFTIFLAVAVGGVVIFFNAITASLDMMLALHLAHQHVAGASPTP